MASRQGTATGRKSNQQPRSGQASQIGRSEEGGSRPLAHDGRTEEQRAGGHPRQGTSRQGMLREVSNMGLARFLGWFSIGLGVTEVAAPGFIAKVVGVRPDKRGLVRLMGLREIGHGVGILSQRKPTEGVWSRIGGDAIDLALLGAALVSPDSKKSRVVAASAAVLGVTALDLMCAEKLGRDTRSTRERAIQTTKTITINRSPEEVYNFWHNFENLASFMYHLESVQSTGGNRSHWVARGPAGVRVEWDAETTEDRPNELIAWRSVPGSDVENSGRVEFEPAPGARGTIVKVNIQYNPPGGTIGAGIAKLLGKEPGQQVQDDLRRFKQVMETGEVVQSDASIHLMPHAAQPPLRARSASSAM
jgi:uncharacterized membrane protein